MSNSCQENRRDLHKKYAFDILSDDGAAVQEATRNSLVSIAGSRKNRPTGFRSVDEIKRSMIPFRHFAFQYLTGCYGLPEGALVEFLGSENIGKSTLLHWLFGGAMERGCPCSIAETEGKPLLSDWVRRSLHSNRTIADLMSRRIEVFEHVHELNQMEQTFRDWVEVVRGRNYRSKTAVPLETPILWALDSFSKLMSPDEAAGRYDYGDFLSDAKKKKMKGVNEASNLVHSKWAQSWSRMLPSFLGANNAVALIVSHQNQKVDMSGTPSYMSADASALYNDTAIGGQAFKQNASLRFIMAYAGLIKDSAKNNIGNYIKIRCCKNSYGPKNRVIRYSLQNENFRDSSEFLQPSLSFDEALLDILVDNKLFNIKVSSKRYTSEELGIFNATAEEFGAEFHANGHALNTAGRVLRIYGYEDVVDQALEPVEDAEPDLPPPIPPPEDLEPNESE